MIKLCECGCGQEIIIKPRSHKYYGIPKFIHGHNPSWNKDKHLSKKTKEKLRQINLGKIHSKATKIKISIGNKGKVISIKTRLKQSKAQKGERGSNWQGGITPLRKQIYNLTELHQWRSDIFQRDNWTCQTCRKRGYKLEAHHIKPFAQILKENNIQDIIEAQLCKELWDIDNGVTLCVDCHRLTKKEK